MCFFLSREFVNKWMDKNVRLSRWVHRKQAEWSDSLVHEKVYRNKRHLEAGCCGMPEYEMTLPHSPKPSQIVLSANSPTVQQKKNHVFFINVCNMSWTRIQSGGSRMPSFEECVLNCLLKQKKRWASPSPFPRSWKDRGYSTSEPLNW